MKTQFGQVPSLFVTLHAGTDYDIRYQINGWEPEQRVTGKLVRIRIAPVEGEGGIPMIGIEPNDGRKDVLVEFPWESIKSVGLTRG